MQKDLQYIIWPRPLVGQPVVQQNREEFDVSCL